MAVELLILANNGGGGRRRGAVICVKEAPDGQEISWGRDEGPPHFVILRIPGIMKKDLDPRFLEFGGHHSRTLVQLDRFSERQKAAFRRSRRHTVQLSEVTSKAVDRGPTWLKQADVEALSREVPK